LLSITKELLELGAYVLRNIAFKSSISNMERIITIDAITAELILETKFEYIKQVPQTSNKIAIECHY
jgi:hypothetical protein